MRGGVGGSGGRGEGRGEGGCLGHEQINAAKGSSDSYAIKEEDKIECAPGCDPMWRGSMCL